MADINALKAALVNAHDAGDEAAAQSIASAIQAAQIPEQIAPSPNDPMTNPAMTGGTLSIGPFDTGISLSPGATNALAGVGKNFVGLGRGLTQLRELDSGALEKGLTANQNAINYSNALDAPLMKTGAGKAGYFVGGAIPAAATTLFPGGAGLSGSMLTGTGLGLATPVPGQNASDIETGKAVDAVTGELAGGVGYGAAQGLSRVIAPRVSALAQRLLNEGVSLTPGQLLGGAWKRVEDGMTSIPFVGDLVKNSQRRSVETFNRAALSRALSPLGENVPSTVPVGREAIDYVKGRLSNAYNDLLPRLRFQSDQQFAADIGSLRQMAQNLPPQQAQEFESILKTHVLDKLTPQGLMSGETLKTVESELNNLITRRSADSSSYVRDVADALREVQSAIRSNLSRNNPADAEALQAINSGYANYSRLRQAGAATGANGEGGMFSPAQLAAAVRAQDKTVGHGGYASGNALMQDLSDAGAQVLPSRVPDSGTPFRHAVEVGVGALAGNGLGLGPYVAPSLMVGGAMSAPYTQAGGALARALLAKRPAMAPQLADAVRALAPAFGRAGSVLNPDVLANLAQ